ncbi:MAG: hydrogenase subunit MbhD domain-containing protein [Cyanobacteria bacterium J06634_6]
MTDDIYMSAIGALLPLVAILLVLQTNPYQALVIRGILGAIAALVYAMLGAADVALTEALVGTMLSITLYAIAVRSSMTLRVGIIDPNCDQENPIPCTPRTLTFTAIEQAFSKHCVRAEILPYINQKDLKAALQKKEVHVTYEADLVSKESTEVLQVRTRQIYDILQPQIPNDVVLSLIEMERDPDRKYPQANAADATA